MWPGRGPGEREEAQAGEADDSVTDLPGQPPGGVGIFVTGENPKAQKAAPATRMRAVKKRAIGRPGKRRTLAGMARATKATRMRSEIFIELSRLTSRGGEEPRIEVIGFDEPDPAGVARPAHDRGVATGGEESGDGRFGVVARGEAGCLNLTLLRIAPVCRSSPRACRRRRRARSSDPEARSPPQTRSGSAQSRARPHRSRRCCPLQ